MKHLLLLLAHYPYDPSYREDLRKLLSEVPDWNSFVRLVNAHGIIALSAYNIKEAGLEDLVPAQSMGFLENGLRQSIVRNAWLAERWKEVNGILTGAGIQHLLLKGMALEHTVYGSKGLRQMTDNDILIRRQEAVEAWKLLQENGFRIALPKSNLHLKIMPDAAQHLPTLYKDGYAVEIHTRLFDEIKPVLLEYDRYFKNAPVIKVLDSPALILPKDIHIRYLLKHFNFHLLGGECQIRAWNDLQFICPEITPVFPDEFIYEPDQKGKTPYRKAIYKVNFMAVPPAKRILFLAGDLFPSFEWMKMRYRCSGMMTIFYYAHRMGKLLWLI